MQLNVICLEGPWKKKNLHEMGIVTQCIAPSNKMNDQYFTNVLLKINAKVHISFRYLICICALFEEAPCYAEHTFLTILIFPVNQLGGMNSKLALEHRQMIPVVTHIPTLILGMDVSHGSPGRADIPSIAAVCLVLS